MRIQCPFCNRTYGASRDCGILVGTVREAVIKCRCGKVLSVQFALAPKDTEPRFRALRQLVARVKGDWQLVTKDPANVQDPDEVIAVVRERNGAKSKLGSRYSNKP